MHVYSLNRRLTIAMDLRHYEALRPFAQRHLLTLQDWSEDELLQCLSLALRMKDMQKRGEKQTCLEGKTLAMIFAKSSTRTRVSFEVGVSQLGGTALFLSTADIQLGRGEPIADTARVLSRMVDGIMIRTFKQSDLAALAQSGSIPVINGLTDEFHPCQVLADLLTIYEKKETLRSLKLAFVGDGVFELFVREKLVCQGNCPVNKLHKRSVEQVCCGAQAAAAKKLLPMLTEEEAALYNRGRNAHVGHVPKNAKVADYHAATAFEALFGYVYLTGNLQRLRELFQLACEALDEEDGQHLMEK